MNKQEFKIFLQSLDLEYTEPIDELLSYFRRMYEERPNKYVGDSEFYSMLRSVIVTGYSLENSIELSKGIIDREMFMLDRLRSILLPYSENFRLQPL